METSKHSAYIFDAAPSDYYLTPGNTGWQEVGLSKRWKIALPLSSSENRSSSTEVGLKKYLENGAVLFIPKMTTLNNVLLFLFP